MHTLLFDLSSPAKYVSGGWFASDESWVHPRRTLDTYVLIIGIRGKANITVLDKCYEISVGDVLIMPSNAEHLGYEKSINVSYLWFHFLAEPAAADGGGTVALPTYMHSLAHSRLVQLGIQLLHIEQADYPLPLAAGYQLSSLLLEIAGQFQQQSIQYGGDSPRKIYEIQEYIRINARQNLSLTQVAEHFHYNKNYLCKIFKKATGHTVQSHITLCKLEIAKQLLLTTDMQIKQIALSAGFADEKYLMRVFREYEGMTFRQYKNAYSRVHFNKK